MSIIYFNTFRNISISFTGVTLSTDNGKALIYLKLVALLTSA